MKHTNFFMAYAALESLAIMELTDAVKAVGGEFIPEYRPEGNDDIDQLDDVILTGSFEFSDGSEDILFTRASVDENNKLHIFGKPNGCRSTPEMEITFLEDGHRAYIIDIIPETDSVSDTRDPKRNESILATLKENLNKSV